MHFKDALNYHWENQFEKQFYAIKPKFHLQYFCLVGDQIGNQISDKSWAEIKSETWNLSRTK